MYVHTYTSKRYASGYEILQSIFIAISNNKKKKMSANILDIFSIQVQQIAEKFVLNSLHAKVLYFIE